MITRPQVPFSQLSVIRTEAPAVVKSAVPVDDMGRALDRPRMPGIGGMFMPRVRDRLTSIQPPWTHEQMAAALRAAERGDMSQQTELMEYMEDSDGELLAYMQTRRLAQCGLKWSIEPANDSTEAEVIARMVKDEISGIGNFPIAFRNMQDAIGKSISSLWIDWQPGGRTAKTKYHIDGIHHISPKRYRFHWAKEQFLILPDDAFGKAGPIDTDFGLLQGAGFGVVPPPWKVIIHRTQIKAGHPAKAGVLRLCTLYFFLRKLGLKDAAIYCDIFGMPGRIFKYPDGMDDDEKGELALAAEAYGTDMVALVSKAVEVQLLETKNATGTAPHFDLHGECGFQMQMAICGQNQTNTHNATGGRTQVKEGGAKIRQDLLEADCIDSETTLTQQLCYPIVGFSSFERPVWDANANTWKWPIADALCPKFKLHYEPPGDFESMIAVDVPLYTVLRLPVTKGFIAKRYESPLPEGVDPNELLEPAAVGAATAPAPADDPSDPKDQPKGKRARRLSFAARLTDAITTDAVLQALATRRLLPAVETDAEKLARLTEVLNTRGLNAEEMAELSHNRSTPFAAALDDMLREHPFATASAERAQDDLDDLADRGVEVAEEAYLALGDQIRRMARKAERDGKTLAQFRDELTDALPDLDASELETVVRRALFVARLHGRATAARKVDES